MTANGESHILDRGYRRFEGERSGTAGAMRSLTWHTTRAVLGLGRKARYKIAPIVIILVGFLPAIFFVGIAMVFRSEFFDTGDLVPDYSELARNSFLAIVIFMAFVAPGALVGDRRDGMLSLYLSTPLTRVTYLASKLGTVVGVLSIIVVLPMLLFLFGLTFASAGPDGLASWFGVFGRSIAAGLLASVVWALISTAASSLTDRRAFATFTVVMLMIGLLTVTQLMINVGDASENWAMLDPVDMPFEMISRLFGEVGAFSSISSLNVYLANAVWAGGSLGLIWWQFRDES